MATKHATLSASGAKRWMSCPPSARLEQQFPNETSEYAKEGSHAHAIADLRLGRQIANSIKPSAFKKKLAELQTNPMYSAEMGDYVDDYVSQVSEIYMAAKTKYPSTLALLEQKLDYSKWVPKGFGTGDVVIVSDGAIEVIDLKYGKGVPVSAENNPQMRLYGLGAIDTYEMLYDFSVVRMTIIQPRLDSISTEEMTVQELLAWAENEVVPKAKQAFAGEGEFCAGDHCQFCRARYTCRARAEENLKLAQYEFKQPHLLDHTEIAEILGKIAELQKWTKDVDDYALDQAVNHGVKFPGWKLVEGRSNRKIPDDNITAAADVLVANNYPDADIHKPKELLGITALEKLVGKKKFGELLSDLIIKPAGKPTLAPESDKRPEISSVASAEDDFNSVLD